MRSLQTISKTSTALSLIAALLASCSHEATYRNIQENNLRRCEEIPIAQQRDCRALYQKDYDEYRRELEQLDRETRNSSPG
jgi:hypothetical protein